MQTEWKQKWGFIMQQLNGKTKLNHKLGNIKIETNTIKKKTTNEQPVKIMPPICGYELTAKTTHMVKMFFSSFNHNNQQHS